MRIVYDAGVLVAADRDERTMWADHRARLELGVVPVTPAPIVAQVSRSSRQVQLRRFLRGCEIVAFDADQSHPVGELLADAATSDVVDGHVVVVAATAGAAVLTSDADDLAALAAHASSPVRVLPVETVVSRLIPVASTACASRSTSAIPESSGNAAEPWSLCCPIEWGKW